MINRKYLFYGLIAIFVMVVASVLFITNTSTNNVQQSSGNADHGLKPSGSSNHIIVIDICSLRKDHISGFGYDRNTTPNLDGFMKESVVFDNFWTQAGWCLPNFATMLTGTRPDKHKQVISNTSSEFFHPLDKSISTLPGVFQQNGFETAGFSGSRFLTEKYGLERGFKTFRNPYESSKHEMMGAASFGENLPSVEKWIHDNKNKKFFLYVTVDDLHSPYHSDNPKIFDPGYKGILDSVSTDMNFANVYNGEEVNSNKIANRDELVSAVQEFRSDPRHLNNLIARYDSALQHTDSLVGQLFDSIKKEGLWTNSIIIVTAHQGEQLGEHNLLGHTRGLYEPILSVPLFIKYSEIVNAKKIDNIVERIDIPATILDVVGLLPSWREQFIGDSLVPLLRGEHADWKKYIFAESKPVFAAGGPEIDERAVRDNRYKLIWHKYKNPAYELYDLQNDPQEKNNLISELPDVFQKLKMKLDQ